MSTRFHLFALSFVLNFPFIWPLVGIPVYCGEVATMLLWLQGKECLSEGHSVHFFLFGFVSLVVFVFIVDAILCNCSSGIRVLLSLTLLLLWLNFIVFKQGKNTRNRLSDVNTNSQSNWSANYLFAYHCQEEMLPDFRPLWDCMRWKKDERKLNFITCQHQKYACNLTMLELSLFSLVFHLHLRHQWSPAESCFFTVNRLMVLAFCHFQHILRLCVLFHPLSPWSHHPHIHQQCVCVCWCLF